MIGRTLGHYQITEKLGEGGMGVVYKARDTHLDRFVALKILPSEKVADPERKRRFVQEAKAASALNHPNIIHVYDIDQADGTDFIAMEFVDGKTLDQLIPRKGMRLNEALKIAVQIADALARAHSAGIIHRDLKPSNIMVDQHGLAKVLDFGLAKLIESTPSGGDLSTQTADARTEKGTIVGTVAYMSPEQSEGKPLDPRSDIFSFGSVLYEMLTGQKAFRGDSNISTLSAVLHQEPKPLDNVPHDLGKVVGRCLRKEPDRRWQTMADLRVALRESSEESDSPQPAAFTLTERRSGRRMMAALIALPFLLLAGWLVLQKAGHRSPPPTLAQLTSLPGSEQYPCFSPDGRQVAFTGSDQKGANQDIYVKLLGETNALRLTTDPAPDVWPAWSPDGRRIAFRRDLQGAGAIWLVSPLAGAEQKLAEVQTMGQMSWSPDGEWLAVARGISADDVGNMRGIFLVPGNGGEPRRLSNPQAPSFDIHPTFSPDGRMLAYASCSSRWSCDVFVQPLDPSRTPLGATRRVTRQGLWIQGLAWSRDAKSLVYSGSWSWAMTPRLWRAGSDGEQQAERLDLAGFQAMHPSVAPAGDRLAFVHSTVNQDVWRYHVSGVAEPFLTSSLADFGVQYSPDGRKIAFSSGRSGDQIEIWTADADGFRPIQLTKGPGHGQGSPRWSPEGHLIAFDSLGPDGQSHIYVVGASGGGAKGISSGASTDFMPSWSRDGRWIYFFSNKSGRDEVWRVSRDGGEAKQITDNGGAAPQESADGTTLFYVKSYESPLFARSLDGGPEMQVIDFVKAWSFAVFADGIYYVGRPGADGRQPIQFYELSTRSSRLVTRVGPINVPGLSVSPDRRTILFSNSATYDADLMMIEGFR